MANKVFIQRGNFGRRVFLLKAESLELTITTEKSTSKAEFSLKSISSDYSVHSHQMGRFFFVPMALATIVTIASLFVAGFGVVGGYVIFYSLAVAVFFIFLAVRGLRPVEYFNFYDHWKNPLFSVVSERGQEEDCKEFVAALIDRLEQVESGITLGEARASNLPKKFSMALPSAEDDSAKQYWKLAFIAAVVGISYPPIEAMAEKEAPFGFMVALGGITCAIAASIASFSKREPHRYWTIIAIALSLVPFAIY
jgi:hypothetical protein